ncbi:MAG: hypothetical protein PHY16_07795 [Methylobacter sp.]|nr:hypothetical protein [Methylobacter sp.]
MNKVIIGITSHEEIADRLVSAWENGQPQSPHIGFESEEQLWKTLTLKRRQILKTMIGVDWRKARTPIP